MAVTNNGVSGYQPQASADFSSAKRLFATANRTADTSNFAGVKSANHAESKPGTSFASHIPASAEQHGNTPVSVTEKGSFHDQLQASKTADSLFLTQQFSQARSEYGPEQWFRDFMNKTPEERYYEALLREMGLTPEQFEKLPPNEREPIEQEIQSKLRRRIEEEGVGFDTESSKDAETEASF